MSQEHKNLQLDYQLCFAVYATSNAFVRAYNMLLETFGLNYPAYLVMLIAWEKDGQSVEEIADKLHLPPSGVEPVLKRLQKAGYLHRRTQPGTEARPEIFVT